MRMSGKQNKQTSCNWGHVIRLFCLYFIVFGTGLGFIGFVGDDLLPDSGWFIWLLAVLAFIIAIFATAQHIKSGTHTSVDDLADKI